MTRIVIKELVWDDWNRKHISKHSVSAIEVVEAGSQLVYHKRTYGKRYLAVGRSKKRLISLVLSREGAGKYYLVTARDAGKTERRVVYEKEQKE